MQLQAIQHQASPSEAASPGVNYNFRRSITGGQLQAASTAQTQAAPESSVEIEDPPIAKIPTARDPPCH